MQCPACGTENAEGAQFCSQCGQALAAQTPEPIAGAQATPTATTKRTGLVGLVIGLVVAFLVVAGVAVGGLLYVNSVRSARAAAEAAVARAATACADAELCAEDGNDAAGLVEASQARLARAKAKLAAGSLLSAAPYREARTLAVAAATSADKVLEKLDGVLQEADSLRESGDYPGAVQAWADLVGTYPRSSQAEDARQAALDMLENDVADDGSVDIEDDLQLSTDVAAMFAPDSQPEEVTAHVTTRLLDTATDELDTLQGLATANADWSRELSRKGTISGAVVNAFQNQEYDSSDVAEIQKLQGMVGALGQPEQMKRLYTVIAEATSLAAECRSIADHPARSTSTSETFTSGQIKSVRDKAAAIQKRVDEGRTIASSLSTTI